MLFRTTQWSQLIQLSQVGNGQALASLDKICRAYWQPVFQMIRRRGIAEQDAADMTQAFFAHALENMTFARADPLRGKFRTFLLGALHRFLLKERREANASKRGGGADVAVFAEDVMGAIPAADSAVFDRDWALTVMESASSRLRDEWLDKGRNWPVMKRFLPGGDGALDMNAAAAQCGTSTGAFKVDLHRLRQRMKELLRAEVARTVSAPHEIDEELAHLRRVLEQA